MRIVAWAALSAALFVTSGAQAETIWITPRLKERFQADTGCKRDLTVSKGGAGLRSVSGCGITIRYVCNRDDVCVIQDRSDDAVRRNRQAALLEQEERRRQAELANLRPRVVTSTHDAGYPVLTAILPGKRLEMRLTAAPTKDAKQVLWTILFKEAREDAAATCTHALVINGNAMSLPEVKQSATKGLDEFRFKLPVSDLAQVARAARVVGRTCEARWQLDDTSLAALRELLMRFTETIALEGQVQPPPPDAPKPAATNEI